MRLRRLKLKAFRNLRDVELDFAAEVPDSSKPDTFREVQTHAIIGQNGSGKSNLIEALVTIFRDLDLNNTSTLDYELEYEIRGIDVKLVGRADGEVEFHRDGVVIDPRKFDRYHKRALLPDHVFVYYSGRNERIEGLFQGHQDEFINRLKRGKDDLLRRLFYCRAGHTQLVLLACFLAEDEVFRQIQENLNIEALDSALFVLKRPYHLRELSEASIIDGDPRYWFARGRYVRDFLDILWKYSVAPITETISKKIDFRRRPENQERLYLFVPDQQKLRALGTEVGTPAHFFRYAEAAYLADLIEEVRISVQHKDSEGQIQAGQLSEGELQLLTVLGLMRITHQDECLFLLDEPDTHLNPLWKLRYFETLERVIHGDGAKGGASQILITTHDPMMVGSLRREQVHILRKTETGTTVALPDQDPVGMGVSGLLKSDLFGLRSTVDAETMRRIDRRYELYAKGKARTLAEDAELSRLSEELADLGFAQDFRDPYFALFVQKMAQHTKFHKETLTAEEQREQDRIADDIISQILSEEDAA